MNERKNYDAEFCGNVPLHNTNLIQDYGYLLVVAHEGQQIIQASDNITELLNRPIQEISTLALKDILEEQSMDSLDRIRKKGLTERVPLELGLSSGTRLQALLHVKEAYTIIELEKAAVADERLFTRVFQDIKHSIAAIEQAGSLQLICEAAIRELRKISGFDGVLMYRFDSDWNGTVIAEEKDDRLEPYLGQTFPASDIPRQARQLYLKNPYRLIPDREYAPHRLYPVINPLTNTFIDLSDCNLRSVPAVHLEYMKNMGIKASMSIRVIRNEQLWGLISCHNIEPVDLSFEACAVFELLSSVISNKIASLLNKDDFDFTSSLQEQKARLMEHIYATDNIEQGIMEENGKGLMQLLNATGLVVALNGRLTTAGNVPQQDMLDNLLLWLEGKSGNKIFASGNLSSVYDEAGEYAGKASGLLSIPIDAARGDYVLCFRPEVVETINWGGNPDEAIQFEKDGKQYHPRNSFKSWQQKVKNHSAPWHSAELAIADNLRSFLFEFRARQLHN